MGDFNVVSLPVATDVQSLPLVLPNNMKFDATTNRVTRLRAVQRTHLQTVPSTLKLLSGIREPMAVLSVTGMARSGKSYILSRMLGSSDAFKLGHSMDPETFGIWIATKVLKNNDFTILLVDTEGVDAASADKQNDISLLVLTILMSSYFVFNTISVPKQAQLEDLQCFVQLVKSMRVSKDGEGDYNKFSSVFPDFLWLLRDTTLTPTDEAGNVIDAKTYLTERLLKPSGGFEDKPSDKVARAIKMFFPSIDCITLPVPSHDRDVMQHVELNQDKLTAEFNEGVGRVTRHILERVKPKAGYDTGTHVTGSQLACMLESYVTAVNDPNTIPVIETSWMTSLRILAERFHNEAVSTYKNGMTAGLQAQGEVPMEDGSGGENTLMSLHKKHYDIAQDSLRKGLGPMCNQVEMTKSMSLLQRTVFGTKVKTTASDDEQSSAGLFQEFWQQNYEKSRSFCRTLLDALYGPIARKISTNEQGYTYATLKQDLEKIAVDYKAESKGPAKQKIYAEFTEFVNSEAKAFEKLEGFKKEEFAEQQKTAEMRTQIESLYAEEQKLECLMVEEMLESKRQAEELTREFNEKVDQMKDEDREVYMEQMRQLATQMQTHMVENMKMIQETGDKNREFLEKSMKMAREQREQDRQQTVKMVTAIQERNAKLAKEMAEQAKKQSKSPLDGLVDVLSNVTSLVGVIGPLFGKFPPLPVKKL